MINGHKFRLPIGEFTSTQKEYLDGFLRAALGAPSPATGEKPSPSESVGAAGSALYGVGEDRGYRTQMDWLARDQRLGGEEKIKFSRNPNRMWSTFRHYADAGRLPENDDVFLYKFHGFFNTSPVQEGLMCRMRFPGGVVKAHQLECVAGIAEALGHGIAHVTTRANLQLRRIPGAEVLRIQERLQDSGIRCKGAGADNVRNITGSPMAGLDPQEWVDVLPLCRELNQCLLENPDYHGLPRKFNVAFDGGGSISCLEDSNDIGLRAVRIAGDPVIPDGTYFRLALGGITGHGDLARDSGLLLKPEECLPAILAMLRVFIREGNRSQRSKARLKYLLDDWGHDRFLAESEKEYGAAMTRFPLEKCLFPPAPHPYAHIGLFPQRQPGRFALGLNLVAGRLEARKLRVLAKLAREFGMGDVRLTVWQNLMLPGIAEADLPQVIAILEEAGLTHDRDPLTASLVACTGSEGCKYGMAPTKSVAERINSHLRGKYSLPEPINIHITGCPHSCAQHNIGDIGLLGCTLENGGKGFHLFLGGGFGTRGRMAKLVRKAIPEGDIPEVIEVLVEIYLATREGNEGFSCWAHRQSEWQPEWNIQLASPSYSL